MLKFTSKLRDGVDYYAAMRRQLPYATSVALNRTAEAVRQALVQQTQQVFDRPTPYTLNALRVARASKGTSSPPLHIAMGPARALRPIATWRRRCLVVVVGLSGRKGHCSAQACQRACLRSRLQLLNWTPTATCPAGRLFGFCPTSRRLESKAIARTPRHEAARERRTLAPRVKATGASTGSSTSSRAVRGR